MNHYRRKKTTDNLKRGNNKDLSPVNLKGIESFRFHKKLGIIFEAGKPEFESRHSRIETVNKGPDYGHKKYTGKNYKSRQHKETDRFFITQHFFQNHLLL
jgi:hypothetical protein